MAGSGSPAKMMREMATDSLTPVVRTTLTADICRKMVSQLIRGTWGEGEKIPAERELCQKLGGVGDPRDRITGIGAFRQCGGRIGLDAGQRFLEQ